MPVLQSVSVPFLPNSIEHLPKNSGKIDVFAGTEEIRQPTEQQKRAIALESIYLILSCAQATGADEDIPEGSRCISISDTLRKSMLRTLEAYVEKGWEYLLEDQKIRRGAKE